jgi:hypothetical protein
VRGFVALMLLEILVAILFIVIHIFEYGIVNSLHYLEENKFDAFAGNFVETFFPGEFDFIDMTIIYLFLSCTAIIVAAMAYSVRVKRRLLYGIIEIGIGVTAIFLSSIRPEQPSISTIVGTAGGIYIVIRGFDNMNTALREGGKLRIIFDRVINFFGKNL